MSHAARKRFLVALVTKFNGVNVHNFEINHLKLKSFWLKMRKNSDFFRHTGCGSENCKRKISAKSTIWEQTTKFMVIFHERSLMMYFKPNFASKNPN
jgi:hypothetical protein